MTNADTNGIGAVASVHLVLQGKGGVGKSFVSSILAQYFRTKSAPVHCLDTDPVNATFAQYRLLGAEHLKVLKRGIVNEKEFDVFVQRVCKGQGVFIVDTGATTFVPLWNYILENQILEFFRAPRTTGIRSFGGDWRTGHDRHPKWPGTFDANDFREKRYRLAQ